MTLDGKVNLFPSSHSVTFVRRLCVQVTRCVSSHEQVSQSSSLYSSSSRTKVSLMMMTMTTTTVVVDEEDGTLCYLK